MAKIESSKNSETASNTVATYRRPGAVENLKAPFVKFGQKEIGRMITNSGVGVFLFTPMSPTFVFAVT
jgi:hypothetical protein